MTGATVEAWPLVDDTAYGLGDGRKLCRGPGWFCWTIDQRWSGMAISGPIPAGGQPMTTWHSLQASAREPFVVMSDLSRLVVAEETMADALRVSSGVMDALGQTLSPLCKRWAVVLPTDWSASWWSAMVATHADALGLALFASRAEAWAHVAAPPEIVAAADALYLAIVREDGLSQSVEAALRDEPALALGAVARALGVSARSLQRALATRGETFLAMRARVRLELADKLLAEGQLIKVTARAVGFASASHFVSWYRRARGVTPGARIEVQ